MVSAGGSDIDGVGDVVEIRIDDDGWSGIACEALARKCYDAASAFEAKICQPVSVLFTGDSEMRRLNRDFRGKDQPTNVLSFPTDDLQSDEQAASLGLPPEHTYLGDIALGAGVCARESAEKNISMENHATHLLVHGLLHLAGYDHQNDEDAELMEARERDILKSIGVADPYSDPLER